MQLQNFVVSLSFGFSLLLLFIIAVSRLDLGYSRSWLPDFDASGISAALIASEPVYHDVHQSVLSVSDEFDVIVGRAINSSYDPSIRQAQAAGLAALIASTVNYREVQIAGAFSEVEHFSPCVIKDQLPSCYVVQPNLLPFVEARLGLAKFSTATAAHPMIAVLEIPQELQPLFINATGSSGLQQPSFPDAFQMHGDGVAVLVDAPATSSEVTAAMNKGVSYLTGITKTALDSPHHCPRQARFHVAASRARHAAQRLETILDFFASNLNIQVPDTVQAAANRAVSIADELRQSVKALSPSELCSSTAAGTTTALADFEAKVQQLATDVHVLHTADTVKIGTSLPLEHAAAVFVPFWLPLLMPTVFGIWDSLFSASGVTRVS